MNTTLPTTPVRHVIVVTLLSLACAFCSGCYSGAKAGAAAPAPSPSAAGSAVATAATWPSPAPAAVADERPITPMESVGAADT